MNKPLICLVEDDPIMGESLADRFGLEGFDIDWHTNATAALDALSKRPYRAVVSDIRLPDLSGDELFRQAGRSSTSPPFVFITAYATVDDAVALLKEGASDYVTKPFDIGRLVEKVRVLASVGLPESVMPAESELGVSTPMRHIAELVPRIAIRTRSVLVTGESGVGKEVVARFIHRTAFGDAHESHPFVTVNCGAVPENLTETEFFGFEKGAFTGADRQKKGYFEQADGGTLFLDEIGDLPLAMQVKLLRALQDRAVKRVGGERETKTDFRLVCATNRVLPDMVAAGRFREDLFYRINVVHLVVPPLRERQDDILWLAHRIVGDLAKAMQEPPKTLHPVAEARLVSHHWPGNVRELQNRLEHAFVISSHSVLFAADVFDDAPGMDSVQERGAENAPLEEYLNACEAYYIKASLIAHHGRVAETAKALGISRKCLWEKMRKHKLPSGIAAAASLVPVAAMTSVIPASALQASDSNASR